MGNKMLIDATHPEETRVVVTRGNRVEEFDYKSASRKQLRGNIYLAKVARIEPSLQAAFVNYGGNRHGFLAFAEIHSGLLPNPGRRSRSPHERGSSGPAAEPRARQRRKRTLERSGKRPSSGQRRNFRRVRRKKNPPRLGNPPSKLKLMSKRRKPSPGRGAANTPRRSKPAPSGRRTPPRSTPVGATRR